MIHAYTEVVPADAINGLVGLYTVLLVTHAYDTRKMSVTSSVCFIFGKFGSLC